MRDELTTEDLRRAWDVVQRLRDGGHDDEGWDAVLAAFARLVGCDDVVSARIDTQQRASADRPRPERPAPALELLTAREQQVSTHVLRGATDREIARALTISTRTVHKHLERIYRKLDLTNRTSLIALLTAQAEQAGGLW